MRNYKLHTYLSGAMLSLLLILGMSACKNMDEFDADSSYSGLFRPVSFASYTVENNANTVGIAFCPVLNAKKYIMEFSEDSLKFDKIVKRVTFSTDSMTAFATSSAVTTVVYHLLVGDLNANQRHSVRLKGIGSDTTLTSQYISFTFKTATENILAPVSLNSTTATFKWKKTSKLNSLRIYKALDPLKKNVLLADSVISSSEMSDSTKVVSSLEAGTIYYAQVSYKDGDLYRTRGTQLLKTAGDATANIIIPLKTGDNINTVLANNAGYSSVVLMLDQGTYNLGSVTIPSGINSLRFSYPSNTNLLPTVNVTKITPSANMTGGIYFEYLKLVGPGSSSTSNLLFNISTAMSIGTIEFQGCNISAFNGLAKMSNASASLSIFNIYNCIVSDIGSTGLANVSTTTANQLGSFNISNSTFINMSTLLADIRCKVTNLSVVANTFYNNSTVNKLSYLFRFTDSNTTPTTFAMTNNILAGGNGGTTLASFQANYTPLTSYSFSYNYKTSDLVVSTSTGMAFTSINALGLSSTDLFVDPVNGNFRIKPTITRTDFAGKGSYGDPRWNW